MKNIVLIGMPGAGKSTVGVLLAKSKLMDFCDTDLVIQKQCGKALCDIIKEIGTDGFVQTENRIIAELQFENCVIATGGSVVYGKEAMRNLRTNGMAVYLQTDVEELEKRVQNIKTRGIAMKEGTTLKELFAERNPLYEQYADITVDCTALTPEECVECIIQSL